MEQYWIYLFTNAFDNEETMTLWFGVAYWTWATTFTSEKKYRTSYAYGQWYMMTKTNNWIHKVQPVR